MPCGRRDVLAIDSYRLRCASALASRPAQHWCTALIILLVGAVVTGASVPAAAYEHKDEVTTFATAMAVAQVASVRCPDVLAKTDAPRELATTLHIMTTDEMAVQIELRGLTKAYLEQATKAPKAWCDDVLERFGPDGTMMRGLLKRE